MKYALCLVIVAIQIVSITQLHAAEPIRVLVWDEQQPEQKQAYGDRYLGEAIAAHLEKRPGLSVKSVSLDDDQQGLDDATLDATDVLVLWCHRRARDQNDERAEAVVKRVMDGKLSLVALHSAHWAKPFVRLMQERAKADAHQQVPESERGSVKWDYANSDPIYKGVRADSPLTPSLDHQGDLWRLTLPQCVFPSWRADGAPSHVTTLRPQHPIASGLPARWEIPQTEMYDEPFHVPTPDEVVFEETWDKGEHFRSGCVWKVGKGHVFYFRPGHETYPVYSQAEPLRVVENAVRWLAGSSIETGKAPSMSGDWGAYRIVSASTPEFVLEAVGGVKEGAVISIQKPGDQANQKWSIVPSENGVRVSPALDPSLAVSVVNGGRTNGSLIVLEKDRGELSQRWTLAKHENNSYSLIAKHAPQLGIDHFGGRREVGAKIDLWTYRADDVHLQWWIRSLAGSGVESKPNGTPTYKPPTIDTEQILSGEIKTFTFHQSKIFPGTVREVTIFIPAQYDGKQPACVYVKTDGFNPFEQKMLETMIATKEIPITVGVFVRPGELPAPMKGTSGRRNRDFEYDGVSDNNV